MQELWQNQSTNLFLWVPFLMAFGASLYFNLPFEPKFILCTILFIISAALILFKINYLVRAISLLVFGFSYAAVFTNFINTPQIPHTLNNINITGIVKNIDYTTDKSRIYIKTSAENIQADKGNAIIRVSANNTITPPHIGDTISATVGLFRPSPADAPEAFDYARWAYFNHLTATGYLTDYETISEGDTSNISALRNYLHKKSNSFLVDTLVLGYKNAVPKSDGDVWTATGVGHVWSISGFHITLVSGWLFAIFYLIFRAIPIITKRIPARIPALICAWGGLLFYLFLSGVDIATVRAFIMATLVFAAFIFGRNAISMRNVCVAFCIIFFMNPHFVMQPGFQLSFAAIFGLIWLWNEVKPKMPNNKILKVIYTATLTSIVATIFTAPFVIAHFYSLPIYGLIGNLILLPIFSVAIMPLVMVGVFTSIFGWTGPIILAEKVYDFLLIAGNKIFELPYATITMPHIPNIALSLIIIGFICMIFIRPLRIKINYILCSIFICCGILITISLPKPVFYATSDHELVAFVGSNGNLEFSKSRASNHYFTFDTWKQINNEPAGTKNIRRKPVDGLWRYNTTNFNLVYIQKFVPLQKTIVELCRNENVDYIVSYFNIDAPKCKNKILRGGMIIYPSGKITYVHHNRLWHNPR